MRTEHWPRRLAIGLLALLLVAVANASWIREYDRGMRAVQQGDWAEAEARFAAAIREDATPQERRRFQGAVFRPYVPHYYAGLAAFRRGDCQKAVEYWSHAPTDTVLAKLSEERAEQQRGLGTCRTRLAQATPPSTPAPTPATSSAPSASQPPATRPAQPAASRPVAAAPAPRPTQRPETPAPTRPATPSSGPAPAVLRSAVEAYLAGRYDEVRRANATGAPDARARAQLHLLRAAAEFTLVQQNGQADAAALQAAAREVRAARAAQASLNPDPVLFSPRFRAFWQQTR